jgi:alpha-ketoglutarate-dependent 2,4-dichlorophenoxyacetate dioxygenase
MTGVITRDTYSTMAIKELHPTFAAEVQGVNFQDLSEQQFQEILSALAKVCSFQKPFSMRLMLT